jgi:ribosome production factor 2
MAKIQLPPVSKPQPLKSKGRKTRADAQAPLAKPKVQKARVLRILKKKEPQLVENTKCALVMKGHHSSQIINEVLSDFGKLLKPNCKVLSRKNEILPFEDANSIEFLGNKNDASLFVVGSSTKKRPNNLVMVSLCPQFHSTIVTTLIPPSSPSRPLPFRVALSMDISWT